MHILCGPADASSFPVASYHSLDPCTDKEAMRNQKSDYLVRRTLLAVYEDLIGCCIRLHLCHDGFTCTISYSSYGVGYKVGKVYLQALMGKAASICKYL